MEIDRMEYYPISEEQFTRAMGVVLPNCTQEALQVWIAFAHDCVEQEQYVDFEPVADKKSAVEQWLEALLVGFYISNVIFGDTVTEQVCALGLLPQPLCLYPSEIPQAAFYLTVGIEQEEIVVLVEEGGIESSPPFFQKIREYEDLLKIVSKNQ